MTFLAAALPAATGYGKVASIVSTMGPSMAGTVAGLGAANTAISAATAPLFSAATGASIMSMLNTGLNLSSAGLALFGGNESANALTSQMMMNARSLEQQAKDDELDANMEVLAGKRDANDITESIVRNISSQRLAFAANGLDPSFGTPMAVEETTRDIAEKQVSTTRMDAQIRAISRRRQAQERILERSNVIMSGTSSARAAQLQGYASAAGVIGNSLTRRAERG